MTIFDIYVINLDKDQNRLKEITRHLHPNKFTRIPGIYGADLNLENDKEFTKVCKYVTPKSAIGCTVSHKKAWSTFFQTSNKEYALILEDDAIPVNTNYMNETELSIQNATPDWDIIKLDYWPNYDDKYNNNFSLLLTAYIINKKCFEKNITKKHNYHLDFDMQFYNLKIYNNPNKIFIQIWDDNNNSNNRKKKSYNPISYSYEVLNFKVIRIINAEFTLAELILFLIIIIIIYIILRLNSSNIFPI